MSASYFITLATFAVQFFPSVCSIQSSPIFVFWESTLLSKFEYGTDQTVRSRVRYDTAKWISVRLLVLTSYPSISFRPHFKPFWLELLQRRWAIRKQCECSQNYDYRWWWGVFAAIYTTYATIRSKRCFSDDKKIAEAHKSASLVI